MDALLSRVSELIAELRDRRIFHVLAVYAAVAFVVAQVADLAQEAFRLPQAFLTITVLLTVLGFPIAGVLTWAFEVTPEGVRRTDAFRSTAEEERKHGAARAVFVGFTLIGTCALGLGAWHLFLRPDPAPSAELTATLSDPTDLAVLYFDPIGSGEDLRYLAEGLTETLTDELAGVTSLTVKSRTSVKAFRSGEATQDSIVKALGVGSYIEGSVRRFGDSVRVTVQLIDANSGAHLQSTERVQSWSERFRLEADMRTAAANVIRRQLGVEVERWKRRRSTESTEAWTLIQKGEQARDDAGQLAARGDTAAAFRLLAQADSTLQKAERLDTDWAEPLLLRGWVAADHGHLTGTTPDSRAPDPYRRGIRLVNRVLQMAPGHAGALELRGTLRFHLSRIAPSPVAATLIQAAEHDLRAALDVDPDRARAWAELSALYNSSGRKAEAQWAAERALEADAFLVAPTVEIMRRLYQISLDLEDFDEAIRWCERGRQRFPNISMFLGCSLFNLALPGGPEPDIDRAWDLYHRLVELSEARRRQLHSVWGQLWVAAVIARASSERYRVAGDASSQNSLADSAEAVVARARSQAAEPLEPWLDYYEANVRLHLSQKEVALNLLQLHIDALPDMREMIKNDWMFRSLWEDPRFKQITGSS